MPFHTFPHYVVFPKVSGLKPDDQNLRILSKASEAITDAQQSCTPPLLRLMEVLRDGFVDGCSVTMLDRNVRPTNIRVPPSIIDMLIQAVINDPQVLEKELMIFDYASSVCYLTLPMDQIPGLGGSHIMILWRCEHVFSPDDVVTAKLMLQMFWSPFKAAASGEVVANRSRFREFCQNYDLLAGILDAIPDIVIVCTHQGNILGLNYAASKSSAQKISPDSTFSSIKEWMSSACFRDDFSSLWDTWFNASSGHAPKKIRSRLFTDGESWHKFLVRFLPVNSDRGVVWAIVATDLEVGETSDEVRSMAAMKSRFLAEISHEIRTPLACVLGTSTLLSHTNLDPDQQELLRTITLSSQQLSNLISNVLDLSRIEENKLILERVPIMLEKCIFEVIELFRANLVRTKIDPIVDLDPSVPQWIMSDELRLRQVLTNLVSNAVKFSEPNSVVAVKIRSIEKNGLPFIEFSVQDEGIGISETSGKKLFESFQQVDPSTTRKYGGSGLGLVISKRLVEFLGGTIDFSSVVGEGSEFHFTIPQDAIIDVPEASLVSLNGFQTLKSKLEDLRAFRISGFQHVIFALRHKKLNQHLLDKTKALGNIVFTTASSDSSFYLSDESLVLATDDLDLAKAALQRKNVIGVTLVEYDQPADLTCPRLQFVKKPARDLNILSSIFSYLTGSPYASLQIAKSLSTAMMPIAEKYPLRILIAEDDQLSQQLLVRILEKLGYKDVTRANDGAEAISIALKDHGHEPQLILMDMQMPVRLQKVY